MINNAPITKTIELDPAKEARKLTVEQIDRIEETIYRLAKHSNNGQSMTLSHNLKNSNSYDEKRKWIVQFYISSFQLVSFISMAKGNKFDGFTIQEFNSELDRLFGKGV